MASGQKEKGKIIFAMFQKWLQWVSIEEQTESVRLNQPFANDAVEERIEAVVGASKNPPGINISLIHYVIQFPNVNLNQGVKAHRNFYVNLNQGGKAYKMSTSIKEERLTRIFGVESLRPQHLACQSTTWEQIDPKILLKELSWICWLGYKMNLMMWIS